MLTSTRFCVIIFLITQKCVLKEARPPSEKNKGRKENKMKISKDLEELFDLESARIANETPDEDEPQEASKAADEQLYGQLYI